MSSGSRGSGTAARVACTCARRRAANERRGSAGREGASRARGAGGPDHPPARVLVGVVRRGADQDVPQVVVAQPGVGRLRVPDHGARHDDDAVPGEAGPPGQVEPVAERAEGGVRAVELVPDVPAHQRAGQPDAEHVLAAVVLALVDLAVLDAGHPPAEPGRASARPRAAAPGPSQLRCLAPATPTEGACSTARTSSDERGRLGGGVVVQQPEPVGDLGRAPADRRDRAGPRAPRAGCSCRRSGCAPVRGARSAAVDGAPHARDGRGASRTAVAEGAGAGGGHGPQRGDVVQGPPRQPRDGVVGGQHAHGGVAARGGVDHDDAGRGAGLGGERRERRGRARASRRA